VYRYERANAFLLHAVRNDEAAARLTPTPTRPKRPATPAEVATGLAHSAEEQQRRERRAEDGVNA